MNIRFSFNFPMLNALAFVLLVVRHVPGQNPTVTQKNARWVRVAPTIREPSRVISWIEMPSATTSAGSAFTGVSPAVSLCESSHRAIRLYARSPLV